jgi:lysophospholipase L1-like esterase
LTAILARLAFWLLLPVAAVQGLWLRRRATRLPGAVGERRGVHGEGEAFHLLALGDSIIDGVGTGVMERSLPVQFATALAEQTGHRVVWCVDGASGRTIQDLLDRLDQPDHPADVDLVLISIGVNDVTGLSSTGHWRRSLRLLLTGIRARWPRARIVFAGLPCMEKFPLPPQPLRFSLGLRAAVLDHIAASVVAGHPGATHVPTRIDPRHHDFCEDGFHPSAESCTLWARELAAKEAWSTST